MKNRLFGMIKKSSLWDDDEISFQRGDNKNYPKETIIMNYLSLWDDNKKIIPLRR